MILMYKEMCKSISRILATTVTPIISLLVKSKDYTLYSMLGCGLPQGHSVVAYPFV